MASELDILKHAKNYLDSLSNGVDPLCRQPLPEDSALHQPRLKKCFGYVSGILQKEISGSGGTVDLRVLEHAKGYIESLSNGADPLSGQPVPEDAAMNQPKLKKCFAYVAGVLQKVIDGEKACQTPGCPAPANPADSGTAPRDNPEPEAAVLLAEAGFPERVVIPDETLPLLKTQQNIEKYLREARLHVPEMSAYHGWLVQAGIFQYPLEAGGPQPVTDFGRSLGFSQASEQPGKDPTWTLCTPEAQRFLTEHLAEIFSLMQERIGQLQAAFTTEVTARIAYSATPVNITALTKMCNSPLPPDLHRHLRPADMNHWLNKMDFLSKEVSPAFKLSWVPTKSGRDLGITKSKNAPLYDQRAQQYLVSHLPEVLAEAKNLRNPPAPRFFVPPDFQAPVSEKTLSFIWYTDNLNKALKARGGVPLLGGMLRAWLVQEGYLEMVRDEEHKTRYLPSSEGEAIGLVTEQTDGILFVHLSEPAQRFAAANLHAIGELQNQIQSRQA